MKRAQLNFLVDAVIAVAFLVTAVTGILFLLPPGVLRALSLGMPGILGVSLRTWHWLHDWSGVVATAGVLLHAALHYRWIVAMTRRTFGSAQAPVRRPAAKPAASAARATAAPEAQRRSATPPQAPRVTAYSTYRASSATRPDRRLITRRRFLAGAAAGLGAAFLGGALLPRLGETAADALTGSNGAGTADAKGGSSASSGSGGVGSSGGGSSGSAGSSGNGGSSAGLQGGSNQATLVSVDTSSCIGCGRCLNVCPAGVFAWDSGASHAVARYASRCIRCHRCLEVCPASAITVNA